MGEFDADLALFGSDYVANAEAVLYHKRWVQSNAGEAQKWAAYRDALLQGKTPTSPELSSRYGNALVAAGRMHLSISHLIGRVSPSPGPAPLPSQPPPSPPAPPGGFGYVYTLGSPTFDGDGFDGSNITQKGWVRVEPSSALPTHRVYFDNSVQVMQVVSPECHTVACELRGGDLRNPSDGTNAQRAHIASWDAQRAIYDASQPKFSPTPGQEFWCGLAFDTNPGYVPHYDAVFGTFNTHVGFHGAIPAPLANINLNVTTLAPPGATTGTEWRSGANLVQISPPRFEIELQGGDAGSGNGAAGWPNENGTFTCRRYLGPVFTAAQLNRVQYRIKWSQNFAGELEVWINGTQMMNVSGICNMWKNAQYAYDPGIYPVLENYRPVDNTLQQNIVYFGGMIRGTTRAQVTVP